MTVLAVKVNLNTDTIILNSTLGAAVKTQPLPTKHLKQAQNSLGRRGCHSLLEGGRSTVWLRGYQRQTQFNNFEKSAKYSYHSSEPAK